MNLINGNVRKLYFTYLISALGSTLMTTVYSTVDMICVGQYAGPVGSASIACVNPFWTIMFAPGVLLGLGGSIMMSNRRGGNNEDSARKYFTVSAILSLIFASLVFLVTYFYKRELLIFFGAEGEVLTASLEYMRAVPFAAPTFTICATLATFIRNDGEAFLPTVSTVIGGVVNIFGDIFFVFDFGLGLGIFGAGLATTIGQIVSFFILISYFFTKKSTLKFKAPDKIADRLLKISAIGLPAFISEISAGTVTVIFNKIIMSTLSANHLAVYGTVSSALFCLICFYMALGTALQPIVSANFGAGRLDRVKSVLRTAIITSLTLGALFTLLTQLFPLQILKLYMDINDEVAKIGPAILRKYMIAVGFTGVTLVISYHLQSALKRGASSALSLLRGLILPISFAFILPLIFGVEAIWFAIPLSELLTLILALFFIKKAHTGVDLQ